MGTNGFAHRLDRENRAVPAAQYVGMWRSEGTRGGGDRRWSAIVRE